MMTKKRKLFCTGLLLIGLFIVWTWMIQVIDVKVAGESQTLIGFSTLNLWFHQLTGVHWWMYTQSDWLSLIPLFICVIFATLGAIQLFQRKSIRKVDIDLLLLGVYYSAVIGCYVLFEKIPINYRPVLIEGRMEASYPSSTTLLVLSVMATFLFQIQKRLKHSSLRHLLSFLAVVFCVLMIGARLWCGVHWCTDILGAVFFSTGAYCLYLSSVL